MAYGRDPGYIPAYRFEPLIALFGKRFRQLAVLASGTAGTRHFPVQQMTKRVGEESCALLLLSIVTSLCKLKPEPLVKLNP